MDDSKSVVSSGAYGIPKWIMKKGMRYEVDDFVVSPPSLDDGGFLRLRYGHGRTSTHLAPLEATAEEEGGMTVEVKDDTLQFSSDPSPTTTTISIGPGGLSVEASPQTTPLTTPVTQAEKTEVHPLLVLPMNFGGVSAASREATKSPEKVSPTTLPTLLEKVQSLSVNTTPTHSVVSSPVNTPFTTPRTSPILGRRRLTVAMDPPRKISAHSYFCTKKYQEDLISRTNYRQDVSPPQPKQVDESSLPPQALDPKMMGQRRRHPKPSALREMNFWAPTSM